MDSITEKRCSRCNEIKSVDDFYKLRGKPRSECKACHSKWQVARYKENEDFRKNKYEHDKKYRQEHKEQYQVYRNKWKKNNSEKAKECALDWWRRNKERTKASLNKWRSSHKEQCAVQHQKRRIRKQSGGGSFTAKEWKELCAKYNNKCAKCGSDGVTVDHVIPLSQGGSNYIHNLQPLCGKCNSSKGTKTEDYR